MTEQQKPQPASGLSRLYKAMFYSFSGLRLAYRDEAAFRQELLLGLVLSILCLVMNLPIWLKCLILLSHALVLIVELLNTSLEAIVDLVSPGFHEQAKKAKDTASAAVFVALTIMAALWLTGLVMVLA